MTYISIETQKVAEILENAGYSVTYDADGDIKVDLELAELGKTKCRVRVDC